MRGVAQGDTLCCTACSSAVPQDLLRQRELRTRLLRNMRSRRQLAQLSDFLRKVCG